MEVMQLLLLLPHGFLRVLAGGVCICTRLALLLKAPSPPPSAFIFLVHTPP
jgi:hypothetical protein